MLLPINHDSQLVRRWPWITTVLIVLSIVVFALTTKRIAAEQRAHGERLERLVGFLSAHPYLELPSELRTELPDRLREELADSARASAQLVEAQKGPLTRLEQVQLEKLGIAGLINPEIRARDEAELREQTRQLVAAKSRSVLGRFAYTPARRTLFGLIGYQFLHGGTAHLLFNMWFLWLVGCNVEDRWGRLLFPGFFLSAGVVAALVHDFAGGPSIMPLIGASGAVAGCMGAFLVRFARTRITFAYWAIVRIGLFKAPAYWMLPLWVMGELYSAIYGSGSDGTAYWAHVGGFGYGALFALGVTKLGIEKRVGDDIEYRGGFREDPRLTEAAELVRQGNAAAALPLLGEVAAAMPGSIDAHQELLRAASIAGDTIRARRAYGRLIALYLDQHQSDAAVGLYQEVCDRHWQGDLPRPLRERVERVLATKADGRVAAATSFSAQSAQAAPSVTVGDTVGDSVLSANLDARIAAVMGSSSPASARPFSSPSLAPAVQQRAFSPAGSESRDAASNSARPTASAARIPASPATRGTYREVVKIAIVLSLLVAIGSLSYWWLRRDFVRFKCQLPPSGTVWHMERDSSLDGFGETLLGEHKHTEPLVIGAHNVSDLRMISKARYELTTRSERKRVTVGSGAELKQFEGEPGALEGTTISYEMIGDEWVPYLKPGKGLIHSARMTSSPPLKDDWMYPERFVRIGTE